jgi:hypothetical protein
MVLGEILIDGVFVAALLTSVACLVYVVYATILERHLLRARRSPLSAGTARVVSFPAAAPARRHGGPGSSALPAGKS